MTDAEKEILDGFNAGYLIEQHRPELAQQLTKALEGVEVPYFEGFVEGSKEFVRERAKSQSISKIRGRGKENIPRPTKERNKEGKDKGFERD